MVVNKTIVLLCLLFVIQYNTLACPKGSVRIIVYNTSNNILLLQAKDEHTCKLHPVSRVRPGIKGKYCVNHDYILKVTTLSLHGDTRLAITAADLWDDLIITTPKDQSPDVEFHHIHNTIEEKYPYMKDNDETTGHSKEGKQSNNYIQDVLDNNGKTANVDQNILNS